MENAVAFFDDSSEIAFQDTGRNYVLRPAHNIVERASGSGVGAAKVGGWRKVSVTTDAEYFRRRLQHTNLADVRQLLTRSGISCHAHDAAQLFKRLAESVSNGTLTILERVGGSAGAMGAGTSRPDVEIAEPVPTICPADLIVNQPPKPPPTLPAPSVDAQAQVAALREAAQVGAPLCELCEKL